MGIADKLIFEPLARALVKAQQQTAPHVGVMAHAAMPYVDKRTMYGKQAEAFTASSWVYKAVSNIAEAAALVPLKVYEVQAEQREEVVNHELELLMMKPNPYDSQMEFMERTFGSLLLNGNAYWYVRATLATTPGELYVLRPDRVKVVPSTSDFVQGYLYDVDGSAVPFERDEVVYFKLLGPSDDYVGVSPIQALAYAIANDAEAQERNYYRQKNNSVPPGAFVTEQQLQQGDSERIRRAWDKAHKGAENAGKIAWLDSGFKWQTLGLTPEEMQYIDGRKLSREEIWQIYGIPMGMWSENATEANAKVGLQVFYNFCLWPRLCRVASRITSDLMPRYGDNLVAEFEDVRVLDKELELEEIKTAARFYTLNEIRMDYYEKEELPGGDVVLNAQGEVIPGVGEAEEKKPPPPQLAPFVGGQPADEPEPEPEEPARSEAEMQAEEAEVEKWQKWALSRFPKQWPPKRMFETKFVDPFRAAWIRTALEEATTDSDIKAAFTSYVGYP